MIFFVRFLARWVGLSGDDRTSDNNLGIYGGLVGALLIFSFTRAIIVSIGCVTVRRFQSSIDCEKSMLMYSF
jgi:hypothetical protein